MNIQRLTVVPDDQLVIVDNYVCHFQFSLPGVHAVQWQSGRGHIEYKDGRQNESFTDIEQYRDLIEMHATKKAEAEAPPPPPTCEERRQAAKAWRNAEITRVAARLDQIRNDLEWGSKTFKYGDLREAARQLNSYRAALVEWTDLEGFEETEPPQAPNIL